jgi:general secretion pathway protein A
MYEEFFGHFGLQRNPFHVSPNPHGFYSTAAHDEALSQLMFGIESRQGMMVLTGEPGTGKTTILHYLLEWLNQHNYSTSYVFHTLVPSTDLLRLILRDFGVQCSSNHKSELLVALKEWLVARNAAGDCPVIIIDEAQALTSRALDELRMLLNLEIPGVKLVQLVLAGQQQLEEKLKWRKLAQLRQRVMCHCRLPALSLEETAGYIGTRLAGAGVKGSGLFPQETVEEVFRYSKGIPRVIHLLCEHALLAAYADRRDTIESGDVMRVARQFDLAGDVGVPAEAFRSDTFCRLIPFPKLNVAAVALPRELELEEEPQIMPEAAVAAENITAVAALETDRPAVIARTAAPAFVRRVVSQSFLVYLSAVGRSFMRDGRQFLEHCATWLGQPFGKARLPRYRRVVASVSAWLKVPLGSARIASPPPQVSSSGHKHF